MNEIKTVLVTAPYTGEYMEKLKKALGPVNIIKVADTDTAGISEALKEADTAFLSNDLNDQIIKEGKKLKWIHCGHAGIEASARPEIFERGIVLSGAAGRSGPTLAEHTFFLILSLIYDSKALLKQQEQRIWGGIPGYDSRKGLYGRTIGIVGMGNTGSEVAKRAKSFGLKVLGYSRSNKEIPENFDRIFCADNGDSLDELLKESDIVVLAIRLSDETHHLIGKHAFEIMKNTAYLINMSRGAIIDEEALVQALKNNEIAGAGCDTFEVEPLPADSPLWKLDNMIITPHCTPKMPDPLGRCLDILIENIELYRQGKTLRNQLSNKDVYTGR